MRSTISLLVILVLMAIPLSAIASYFTPTNAKVYLLQTENPGGLASGEITEAADATNLSTHVEPIMWGGAPSYRIRASWGWFKRNTYSDGTFNPAFVSGVGGLRGYAPGFPLVRLTIFEIRFAEVSWVNETNGTENHYLPIQVFSFTHPDLDVAFVTYVDIQQYDTSSTPTIRFYLLKFFPSNGSVANEAYYEVSLTDLPITMEVVPEFYVNATTNALVFGWHVYYKQGDSIIGDVQVAFASAGLDNITLHEIENWVREWSGWYLWFGVGVEYYAGEDWYPATYLTLDHVYSIDFVRPETEIIMSRPQVKNYEVDFKALYNAWLHDKLPWYYGPSGEEVNIKSWQTFWSAIIPFGVALAFTIPIRRSLPTVYTVIVGGVVMVFIGYLMGWDTITFVVAVMSVAVAVIISLRVGE